MTSQTMSKLIGMHEIGKEKASEFFIDSDKWLFTTIDEYSEVPSEDDETNYRLMPISSYNGSDKLLNQKGKYTMISSNKNILLLNSNGKFGCLQGRDDNEEFAQPLCAYRAYNLNQNVNHSEESGVQDESESLYDLSESSVSGCLRSYISSARSMDEE